MRKLKHGTLGQPAIFTFEITEQENREARYEMAQNDDIINPQSGLRHVPTPFRSVFSIRNFTEGEGIQNSELVIQSGTK